jgi:hypothetical protein
VSRRILERVLTDSSGHEQRVCIEIDEGTALDREVTRLANKLRASRKHQKVAMSAGGVLRVWFAHPIGKTPK